MRSGPTARSAGRLVARRPSSSRFCFLWSPSWPLVIGQVVVVGRDRVLLTHSAREGARQAAVGASDADVRAEVVAASRLAADRLEVSVHRSASTVEVTVRYDGVTDLPIVGALVDNVSMVAVARMRREIPP